MIKIQQIFLPYYTNMKLLCPLLHVVVKMFCICIILVLVDKLTPSISLNSGFIIVMISPGSASLNLALKLKVE